MRKLGAVLAELSHATAYLPDEPEPIVCPTCKGAGYVSGKWTKPQGDWAKATSHSTAVERSLCPCPACKADKGALIRAANLQPSEEGSYDDNVGLTTAALACEALLNGARWVVFMRGPCGVGKTYLANDFGCRWVAASLGAVCCVVAGDLLDRLRESQSPESTEKLTDLLAYYGEIPLLILDDLGAERMTDFAAESMFKIIDRRLRNERATIVTSNVDKAEIDKRIGRRIASRLSVGEIVVTGKDRRRGA